MSDRKRGPAGSARINIYEPWGMSYRPKKPGVSEEMSLESVGVVCIMAGRVRATLKTEQSPHAWHV